MLPRWLVNGFYFSLFLPAFIVQALLRAIVTWIVFVAIRIPLGIAGSFTWSRTWTYLLLTRKGLAVQASVLAFHMMVMWVVIDYVRVPQWLFLSGLAVFALLGLSAFIRLPRPAAAIHLHVWPTETVMIHLFAPVGPARIETDLHALVQEAVAKGAKRIEASSPVLLRPTFAERIRCTVNDALATCANRDRWHSNDDQVETYSAVRTATFWFCYSRACFNSDREKIRYKFFGVVATPFHLCRTKTISWSLK
jgi:hypothetical protein